MNSGPSRPDVENLALMAATSRDPQVATDLVRRWISPGAAKTYEPDVVLSRDRDEFDAFVDLIIEGCVSPRIVAEEPSGIIFPMVFGSMIQDPTPEGDLTHFFTPIGRREYVTVSETVLWRVPRPHHLEMMSDPAFMAHLYRRRVHDRVFANNILSVRTLSPGHEAVCRFLLVMCVHMGRRIEGVLALNLSQDALAELCAVSRRTVNISLKLLKNQGILETGYQIIYVHDEKGLVETARVNTDIEVPEKIKTIEDMFRQG